jgi:hypothetical protein
MPDVEKLKTLLLYLGIPVGTGLLFVLLICIALWMYPSFKLIIGDFLRIFGKTSKWVRRKSIETEVEGSINMFTKGFNSELSTALLPECHVEWVTPDNASSFIAAGKSIVRLSFGEDHDLNFYNAANTFVGISLLPHSKPFLHKKNSKAIDLLMLKNLLSKSRREALKIFNTRFRDEQGEAKERFFQCEETDNKGLFKRILLQEYHFWGESLGNKTPNDSHTQESEEFWEWFYELATRKPDEMTDLSFRSQNFNIGVILVASAETYENFGKSPYIRRAYAYTSNGCTCLYILSRGIPKGRIAKEIAQDLISTRCFQSLTKNPDIKIQGSSTANEEPRQS